MRVFKGLQGCDTYIQAFLQGLPQGQIGLDFTADLRFRMRKVWMDMADMNPLESDNKVMTYHFWFACPLLHLQADSCTQVRNGGAPLMVPHYLHFDLPKNIVRNLSKFCCEHILSQWNPSSSSVEMATVTSFPVLLFKMRCMLFFTVKTCLRALSNFL